ncbi:MAG TPA: IS66 family transposase zinc-finger binding domain-containing protein [Phycisphaerae bacterium]|nr:IS66 family transposase zinc-finger binding domain-containing protein [Phycisphaerae bacterium]HNU44590.1 IS66 family transposase zinc-finger binding domain-containing protein [Phycisphaerae bacterium]
MKPSKVSAGLIEAAQRGQLTEARAVRLARENPEVFAVALLAVSRRIAELQGTPQDLHRSTPSGMVPVHTKPNRPRGRRKPGAKTGHPRHRRETPTRMDRRESHRLRRCPGCGGPLQRCQRHRTRTVADIPENLEPVVTEHAIHRDYCPRCKQHVEPTVPDAMPNATLGHRIIVLTSWFHYGLGVTIEQVIEILQHHPQTRLTAGGLVDTWRRLAKRTLRHRHHLLTFLDYDQVACESNFAERQIGPAVVLRKSSQSNRSGQGAAVQAVLRSIHRTVRLRGHDPITTIATALRTAEELRVSYILLTTSTFRVVAWVFRDST